MTNRIISLSFNEKFFLSPHYKGYIAREFSEPAQLVDTIIVSGDEMGRPYDDEFVSVLSDDEVGTVDLLPDGDYTINIDFNSRTRMITLGFFNIDTKKTEATVDFDPKKYLSDYFEAFNAVSYINPTIRNEKNHEEAELAYSIQYLKKNIGQILQGNENFWKRFHGDFDIATSPMNVHYNRVLKGQPSKKVHHLLDDEYQKLKPRIG